MASRPRHADDTAVVRTGYAPPAIIAVILGPWAKRALCAEADPEIFFPAHDDPAIEARKICTRCSVRTDCLQFALDNHEQYGIWGGLDPKERANLRRKLTRPKPAQPKRGAA
jgi:WhiB family transcriptional regulator, redox-sensing transcriptional regulator